jgi:hypothetical protein
MKISIESPTIVKMLPESEHEKESLEALWKIIIRCDQDSKVYKTNDVPSGTKGLRRGFHKRM